MQWKMMFIRLNFVRKFHSWFAAAADKQFKYRGQTKNKLNLFTFHQRTSPSKTSQYKCKENSKYLFEHVSRIFRMRSPFGGCLPSMGNANAMRNFQCSLCLRFFSYTQCNGIGAHCSCAHKELYGNRLCPMNTPCSPLKNAAATPADCENCMLFGCFFFSLVQMRFRCERCVQFLSDGSACGAMKFQCITRKQLIYHIYCPFRNFIVFE